MQIKTCPWRLTENGGQRVSVGLMDMDIKQSYRSGHLCITSEVLAGKEWVQHFENRIHMVSGTKHRERIIDINAFAWNRVPYAIYETLLF